MNGFGGCWWGLHFIRGKYRYSFAPIWRFCTVSSRQIHPSDGRLSFLSKPVHSVLTHIHNKKVQTIPQRSPVKWRVETWLVVLSQGFPHRFQGRQVFTYHDGRLLSHWLSFYQHHTTYHVNGFGGCWWGLHFMRGKYRYSCAPIWRFCTVSSWQIHPSDGRLSFLSKPVPLVLTHIHNKKVQTIPQRSPVKWRVETWLVISSPGYPHL